MFNWHREYESRYRDDNTRKEDDCKLIEILKKYKKTPTINATAFPSKKKKQ
jgi:uncharacterized protein with von Willebrand factor type A (vWA) domain